MAEKIETDEAWNRFQKALKISKELLKYNAMQTLSDWEMLFTILEDSDLTTVSKEDINRIEDARIHLKNATLKNAGFDKASDTTWKYVKELTHFALTSGPTLRISIGSIASLF